MDRRGIRIKRKYLQFYRVKFIDWDGGFGIGSKIFVKLFQDGIDRLRGIR